MMVSLSEMTNTELKQYISLHRNDRSSFEAAMTVLMSRRNPANRQPYPLELTNPEVEVEDILRAKLNDR